LSASPDWQRRFRAARVSLPSWAEQAPQRSCYATNASGVWQLVSWDVATGAAVTLTDKPTGVRGGVPTTDGSGVVWFDDDAGDEVGGYVVTPFAGGPSVPLAPDLGRGWAAGVALRPARGAIGIATRDGFAVHTVELADGGGAAASRRVYHHQQPADVGDLSADGELLAISHCEHGDTLHPDTAVLDAATGKRIGELSDGAGNTVVPAGWSPVAGDQRLALDGDRTGQLRPQLWDAASGERGPLPVELPGEVWVADWWPDATALLLGHDHLGRTELHRYEVGTGELTPVPTGETGTVAGARVRDDGAIWYAFTSSAIPPQIRTRDHDGDRVLLAAPGEEAPAGRAYSSLHYSNDEGAPVHAFLALPADADQRERGLPLVVDVHGGPHAQAQDRFDPQVQAWVDHGFAVLMPNYRGSTGYGKAWADALEGDPGRPELADLAAGRAHLVAEGVADPERVVLAGASWGGYLSLMGAGTHPDDWSAVVAVVPVADYPTAYADESPMLQELDRTLFGGTPEELPALYRQRSPLTHVEHVTAPVLVITGANDTRCPRRQVDNYVAALAERGVAHTYDVFEAGHGSLSIDEAIREQALALDFVAEHLGTLPAER
jgi:dipeptidyl aminopeptidase/acylaminoacyl peptidase